MKITITPINVRLEAQQQRIVIYTSGCITSAGGGTWGSITGTLSDQTDLQAELDSKANSADLGAVATSNDYDDLDNKPTIQTATKQTVSISVADWSGGTTCTKTVSGVTATSFQDYYFSSDSVRSEIISTNVRPTGQDTDEITFTADSTPTAEIIFDVTIKEVS